MKTLIIGAGPVGLATALSLKHANVGGDIVLLDATAKEAAPFSDRNIALSLASWRALARIGVDTTHAPRAAITEVEITQRGAFGLLRLRASDVDEHELGAAMPYPALKSMLDQAVDKIGIERIWSVAAERVEAVANHALVHLVTGEALRADMVVIADGASNDSALFPAFKRYERDAKQVAVIAKVIPTQPKIGVAFERFTRGGALALIPRAHTSDAPAWTLVWARDSADAARLLDSNDEQFSAEINAAFGSSMGRLQLASQRTSYPLTWRWVEPRASGCVVALGNAAQSVLPVAAQGLNLGLRDAIQLSDALNAHNDVSAALASFARNRALDRVATIGFSGVLAYGFDGGGWALDVPRGLALTALQMLTPLRRDLIRRLAI